VGQSKAGYEGQLFYGLAGATAATQVTNCTDLDYDQQPQRAPTTDRGDGTAVVIETSQIVSVKPVITWTMFNRPADTTLQALIAAAKTAAVVALRTKDYSAGKGFDGDCNVSYKHGKPLNGMQTLVFTAEAAREGRTPQLYV
jgi:hypothetical protein